MALNHVAISGNLTRDAELRSTQGGSSVLTFSVAVNDRRRNSQTGEWEDYPNYIDCTVFGNRAEALSRYLTRGMKVAVEGKLRWSQWEREGQKRSKVEVVVDEVELMSQRQQNGPQSAPQPAYATQPQHRYANPPQPQMAPQMPAQAPTGYVAAPGVYQPAMPQPQAPQPQDDIYFDEPIPF